MLLRRLLTFVGLVLAAHAHAQTEQSKPDTSGSSECLSQYAPRSRADLEQLRGTRWIRDSNSDTVVVFVHGIWSDSVDAWLTQTAPCMYWPDLVKADTQVFDGVDVLVAGYHTRFDSGRYSIDDAAGDLMTSLRGVLPGANTSVLRRKNIVFVAHSLGGLVLRQALVKHANEFTQSRVALALYGSPAKGSDYATIGKWFESFYPNTFVNELASTSAALPELNNQFREFLKGRSQSPVRVAEFFEGRFPKQDCWLYIACNWVTNLLPPIVDKDAAGNFDLSPVRVSNTDHLTLVKPVDQSAPPHLRLRDFYGQLLWGAPRRFSGALGSIGVVGNIERGEWRGQPTQDSFVVVATHPCDPKASPEMPKSCGPWTRTEGAFNPSSIQDGASGFVVEAEDQLTGLGEGGFQFKDTYIPGGAASVPTFEGKRIASTLVRAAEYVGNLESAVAVKTTRLRRVAYVSGNLPYHDPSPVAIPRQLNATLTVKVPTTVRQPSLRFDMISGEWAVPIDALRVGHRYGVVVVQSLEKRDTGTLVSLMVSP